MTQRARTRASSPGVHANDSRQRCGRIMIANHVAADYHPVSWTGWRSTTMLMILYDLRRSRSQRQRARKKAATTRLIGKPPRPLASATSMPLITMTRNHAWRPRSCQASLPCVALLSRCTFSSTSLYVQVLAVLDPVLARALRPCVYNVASSSSPKSSKSLPYVPV